jgi:hypothetical protein
MEQRKIKHYESTTQGNYIFINEFLLDIDTREKRLIEMTEIQISNSRINSIVNFSMVQSDELERIGLSVISNNVNAFTFQKYTEFVTQKEQPVLDSEGNDTGETTTEQVIELLNNQFICDGVEGSFDDVLIPFYSENTGFSLTKTLNKVQ